MALISCVVTAQLICALSFANAKCKFIHDAAHMYLAKSKGSDQTGQANVDFAGSTCNFSWVKCDCCDVAFLRRNRFNYKNMVQM